MTSSSSENQGGPTTEQVCAALRVLGVKVPEDGDGLSRAEALGFLLVLVEGVLVAEDDPVALEATFQGYFGGLTGTVKAAGIPEGSWSEPLQEMWVRALELRVRRAAFDWNHVRWLLPRTDTWSSASAVHDTLLAAADLLDPFYPRMREPEVTRADRFYTAFRAARAHIDSAEGSIEGHRFDLQERGFTE
ncbi:hypothetical protein [Streptomyces sp. NPDC059080]|uniref:hypothetical protein n=1 Tax=Streptomyces sp. NPDC059080 TaxID=3346718 RepID=UPI003698BB21